MCFLLSFFYSKISELCNSEVLFSLNASPTPYSPTKTFFWTKLCSKNENIHLRDFKMLFSNMDLNFAHFFNLNFAHFETEESFGLIWVNLQKYRLHLQISISGILKVLVSDMGFIFAHFV